MVERVSEKSFNKSEFLSVSLREQQKFYQEWLQEDSHLIGQMIIHQSFSSDSEVNLLGWKSKTFHEEGDYDFYCKILGNWHDLIAEKYEQGLILKGKLLHLPSKISLRSLAVDIKIRLSLSFHSSFYLFLRVVDNITPETPVLKLLKDSNLRGLFFVFAHIDPTNNKFKFIKQNQVPESPVLNDDTKELELSVIDNGNDQVFVTVGGVGKNSNIKATNFVCSGFLPEVRDANMWMAGIGDNVCVKSVTVQYRERLMSKVNSKKSPDCVCTIT